MKLKEIIENIETLNELIKIKMPIKASYSISRLIRKLTPEIEIYNEKRTELAKELGELNKEKTQYIFKEENGVKFAKELKELLDTDISTDFIKIKISDLGDISIEPRLLLDFIFDGQ